MLDLIEPMHLILIVFTYLIPVGLFIWAVQRISRAIENAGRGSRNGTMKSDG